jgi:iron complex transport system substrate-binding protein
MLIRTRAAASVAAAVALALLAGGCGEVESGVTSPLPTVAQGHGFPVRVRLGDGRELTIAAPPRRILLANAYLVDVVSRLVPAERVVALPEQARTWTRLVDVDDGFRQKARFHTIDLERAASFEPDLVLCSPFNVALAGARAGELAVPTLVLRRPTSLDELHSILRLLGRVLGAEDRAGALRAELDARVAALEARPGRRAGLGVVTYSNLGGTGWTSGTDSMADVMIRLAGMRNLSGALRKRGHERLTFEELIAIDPDVIVHSERFGEASSGTEQLLREEPALRGLRAVRAGRIVALHPRFFSTCSQEVVTGAEQLAAKVDALLAESAPEKDR